MESVFPSERVVGAVLIAAFSFKRDICHEAEMEMCGLRTERNRLAILNAELVMENAEHRFDRPSGRVCIEELFLAPRYIIRREESLPVTDDEYAVMVGEYSYFHPVRMSMQNGKLHIVQFPVSFQLCYPCPAKPLYRLQKSVCGIPRIKHDVLWRKTRQFLHLMQELDREINLALSVILPPDTKT